MLVDFAQVIASLVVAVAKVRQDIGSLRPDQAEQSSGTVKDQVLDP